MRLWLGGAAVVAVVVGGAWLVLAVFFGHLSGGQTAYARSAACLRRDRVLTADPADASRYAGPGLHALGIRWRNVRAVALFSDSLSPGSVDRADARILAVAGHGPLLHDDNISLFYVTGPPTEAAQAAIGRCVYLVHYNRVASALGIYINPRARLPFLPGARRDDREH
jgi:hypothetical protein